MSETTYPDIKLFIGNAWMASQGGETYPIINPGTGDIIGKAAKANRHDLELAVANAVAGFAVWRDVSPYERSRILRRAADTLRQRRERIARLISLEMGKP
ncbi:MAG: aldehyde dehydrogenase family protein, partial [Rhodospirillales bacterium]|nr:aldehyde dehydrogenase family protein [Rhodospirillales bacterium]